jgi:hypothetical protein
MASSGRLLLLGDDVLEKLLSWCEANGIRLTNAASSCKHMNTLVGE